jgi:hypothetical protein
MVHFGVDLVQADFVLLGDIVKSASWNFSELGNANKSTAQFLALP